MKNHEYIISIKGHNNIQGIDNGKDLADNIKRLKSWESSFIFNNF